MRVVTYSVVEPRNEDKMNGSTATNNVGTTLTKTKRHYGHYKKLDEKRRLAFDFSLTVSATISGNFIDVQMW